MDGVATSGGREYGSRKEGNHRYGVNGINGKVKGHEHIWGVNLPWSLFLLEHGYLA